MVSIHPVASSSTLVVGDPRCNSPIEAHQGPAYNDNDVRLAKCGPVAVEVSRWKRKKSAGCVDDGELRVD